MKIVILGNNVAGTFSAQNMRYLNDNVEIEIYTRENYPYYTRVNLPELISEKKKAEELIIFDQDWYSDRNINLYLNKNAVKIDPSSNHIYFDQETNPVLYDKLVLALGSIPNIPPIKNAVEMKNDKKGVFTLRSIDDALEIKEFIKKNSVKKAIVIGGGLLGLELANQVKDSGLETTVVEFFPRLLPRQLDEECGTMLKQEIESRGIKVILSATTEEILGNGTVSGIKLKDGTIIDAGIVLIQAGIRPIIDIANDAGIETNRGIIVNEFLETSEKNIYAVGDCLEYKEQIWGIIPACMEQSKIVAASVIGSKKVGYEGTTPKNTLKIVGLDLTSIGIIDPSKEEGPGWEILKKADKDDCCYQKLILKENKLKGAILFGDSKAMSYVYKKMEEDVDKEELRRLLELYIYVCENCGMEYDEAVMDMIFEDLPADWVCPKCKNPKSNFNKKQ